MRVATPYRKPLFSRERGYLGMVRLVLLVLLFVILDAVCYALGLGSILR